MLHLLAYQGHLLPLVLVHFLVWGTDIEVLECHVELIILGDIREVTGLGLASLTRITRIFHNYK